MPLYAAINKVWKMKDRKQRNLTYRQKQTLSSIYYRTNMYGLVKCYETSSDLGVSIGTLSNHLDRLIVKGLVGKPPSGNSNYMDYNEKIVLTKIGEEKAKDVLKNIGMGMNDAPSAIMRKIEQQAAIEKQNSNKDVLPTTIDSFEKTFRELVEINPTEPVLTSIAMYTELDGQLHELRRTDRKLYRILSSNKLNLEIRNGRLASIAIPVALKQNIFNYDLDEMLGSSWSWMGTVDSKALSRYMYEAMGLGLIKIDGNRVEGLKSSTTDTVSWLASKTSSTFLNIPATAPKATLIAFREAFNLPNEEELLYPNMSDIELPWALKIYDNLQDKGEYKAIMKDSIDILLNKTEIIKKHEASGRLVPRVIMRRLETAPEIKMYFDNIMKYSNENNPTATILMMIMANPGITIGELHLKLTQDKWILYNYRDFEFTIHDLARCGLVHIAKSKFSTASSEKLYAFSHIPFFIGNAESMKEVNAVLKGMNPYIMSTITETMDLDERTNLYEVFGKLLKNKEIVFDELEREFDKKFSRKVTYLSNLMTPYTNPDKDFSRIKLSNSRLGKFLVDVAQYTLLTSNEALGISASTFTDIIGRYSNLRREISEGANPLVNEFIDRGVKKTKQKHI